MSLRIRHLRYDALIGTGGIGAGSFFALNGNETLGREESRAGRFLDRRDYCKLHIIAHYVRRLLGERFAAMPIGRVGGDAWGSRLLGEMRETGLDLACVEQAAGEATLFAFCFIYPDGTGGNLSPDDSACRGVTADYVRRAAPEFERRAGRGLALAAPEVPLDAREALLDLATRHRFFRAAAFTTQEVPEVIRRDLLRRVDLLAVNRDEAAALAGVPDAAGDAERLARAAAESLARCYPALRLSITAGRQGSWCWDGEALTHEPGHAVPVACTAGAGDAHLAGLLTALAAGLPLRAAQQLGGLVAAMSVTSPHTIHPGINPDSLAAFAAGIPGAAARLLPEVRALLGVE